MISFLLMISLLLIILLILSIKFQQRFFKSPPTNSIDLSAVEATNYLRQKMTTKAKIIEGRNRILNCLALCGGEQEPVILLELQKAYIEKYGSYLNKEELRTFFGKGHIKQVFELFMKADVKMETNVHETGSLYLQMKRPLAEALASPPPVLAKNSVPIKAESEANFTFYDAADARISILQMQNRKKAPVHVPLPTGALPKKSPVRKEMIGTLKKSSQLNTSAYSLSKMEMEKPAKGSAKMNGSNTAQTTPTKLKMNDFNEEALSDRQFVPPKSPKSTVKSSTNIVVVKPKQPADADGLYSSDDDDEDEEEEEEGMDEEEEEEHVDEDFGFEENDHLLKNAKMNGEIGKKATTTQASSALAFQPSVGIHSYSNAVQYIIRAKEAQLEKQQQQLLDLDVENNELKEDNTGLELDANEKSKMDTKIAKVRKMMNSAMQDDQQQQEDGTKQQGKISATMKKKPAAVPKPASTLAVEKKKPVISANKLALNTDEDDDESTFTFKEASTDEEEEEEAANDVNDTTEIVPEAIINQQMVMETSMPNSFKYKMLAIITTLVQMYRVYKVTDLHEMLSKFEAYKLEYATYFPSTDALIQFVESHCDAINLLKFEMAKDEALFVLDENRIEQLDYLQCKIGKSLEVAAATNK